MQLWGKPGLWTAVVWCAATIWPVVEFVWMAPETTISYAYPRNGLDTYAAQALLALATALALAGSALLRRRPATGFGVVVAATIASTLAWKQTEIPPPQYLSVDIALGFLAAGRSRRTSLWAAASALAVLSVYLSTRLLIVGDYSGTPAEPYLALTVVIAWLIGDSVRQAREHAERSRSQAAAQAVAAERHRIARELHDMVAHSIGVIALQAGAAGRVIDSQPAAAREALKVIENSGRETLSGLRRMLGALRQAEPGHAAQAVPGLRLADVGTLAEETTAAGVRVDVRWLVKTCPLPPDIDMSAYRIVQEAVTNVVRHAGTDSCRVSIDCRDDWLAIEVTDRGCGSPSSAEAAGGTGWGIPGMRERVGLLRGEFSAGPAPEGGFRVTARLPVTAGDPS